MKHNLRVTSILIILFLMSHVLGLFVIKHYLPKEENLPLGIQKPEFEERTSYIPIIIAIFAATVIALVLIKFAAFRIWKLWYLASIFITLIISFNAFIPEMIALFLAIIFSLLKTFRNGILIHNFTEIFVYGGLAAIFVPVLSVWSIFVLLVLISIYDVIAVWKTRHMISMAKFQIKSKIFAGLFVPYSTKVLSKGLTKKGQYGKEIKVNEAVLGGGDIAFPLMFSGVMLKIFGFSAAIITSFTAALALAILFFIAKKKKFYPAMPFITTGSLTGYFIVLLLF
ncbi:hypothetical protein J4230_01360 [Candidatus Woesearchaeota archaeon]|nr:hypothetical protein [Candidatus Woesearchaeota archaeon]